MQKAKYAKNVKTGLYNKKSKAFFKKHKHTAFLKNRLIFFSGAVVLPTRRGIFVEVGVC